MICMVQVVNFKGYICNDSLQIKMKLFKGWLTLDGFGTPFMSCFVA